jgi:hypothetical protein
MKIGIFGDSFGDDYNLWPTPYIDVGPSWVDYLRSQNIEIDNYCSAGSCLFYSYQNFISNYQKYDKIIFLVTSPGRITVQMEDKRNEDWFSFSQVENELKHCFDVARKIKLNAIRDYFIYVKNSTFDDVVHKLLIEDISKKHNDILMLPCFGHSGISNQTPLIDLAAFEAKFWNMKELLPNSDTEYDARKCHLCDENNLMLGQEMYNWIKTGSYSLKQENFKTPTKEFSHYFRPDPRILLKIWK